MTTLAEIKTAAATLSAEDRSALVVWLSESQDVLRIGRESLRREIQVGSDEIERGQIATLDMLPRVKRNARTGVDFANHSAFGSSERDEDSVTAVRRLREEWH